MSDRDVTAADARRYWANVRGRIVAGWELATAWDTNGKPIGWRTITPENSEDQQLLRDLGLTRT